MIFLRVSKIKLCVSSRFEVAVSETVLRNVPARHKF